VRRKIQANLRDCGPLDKYRLTIFGQVWESDRDEATEQRFHPTGMEFSRHCVFRRKSFEMEGPERVRRLPLVQGFA